MSPFALIFVTAVAAADLDAARQAQTHGAELHRQGDLKGALSEFDRAVRLAPDSALAWYNRGLVRRDLKNCRAALADFSRALELQPDFFNALYQRGNCRQALAQYTQALADYSQAAALPGRIDARFLAYYARADALRRLGRLEEADADYSHVMELRGDTTALRSRAWVSFYRGRWMESYRDVAKYVHDTQAKEPDAAYAVILGVLALRRAGRATEASAFLEEWRPQLDGTRWPAPILGYLKDGRADALLAAAKGRAERTEARAYLGSDLIAQGEPARGIELLRQVLREDEPGYLEYDLAYHELRRLGLARAVDRRQPKR